MNRFNLSDWALEHRSLVWYFMIIFAVAGAYAYVGLGREEDPSFTIKTMVIQAQWPGASAQEVTQQVTDRIEKKLQEIDNLEHTRSITTAGQTIVFVDLLPETNARDDKPTWSRVRNLVDDIRHELPRGVVGPAFDDQFGDVYGNIFALTGDSLSQRELRDFAEDARTQVLKIADVGKVDIVGAQDEVIYLEFSTRKIAALGIDRADVIATLQAQNAVTQSGFVQTGPERIALRVGGRFVSEDTLREINLRVNDRFFPLTDVASVTRGYMDPPVSLFRFNRKPAIGLAIGMKTGGNLRAFWEALEETMSRVVQDFPVGVSVEQVSDQPKVVHEAVGGFTKALFEAVTIVLAISFISLGFRAGLVVAVAIPLVLAITFMVMLYTGISLQRISLGALIIDWNLPHNSSIAETSRQMAQLEREVLTGNPAVEHWSTYVRRGAPRFILSFDVQPADASFGQTVIVTKGLDVRDTLKRDVEAYLQKTFPGTDAYVKLLEIGPPVGKPIQYRVSGENLQTVRDLAQNLGSVVGTHPSLKNLAFDWNEPARVVKIDVLQDKARQLGVSSQDIAMALNTVVQGDAVTQVRDDIYLIDVVGRAAAKERGSIDTLLDLQLQSSSGQSIPLSSVAAFRYELEQPTIWRRDRVPTITVKAGIAHSTQPATVVAALSDRIAAFEKTLPVGYSVAVGGAVEESAKSQGPIAQVVPAMLLMMATLLMVQLQSFHRLFLVFSVAPLALIGVVVALLASNSPLGFVALLGVLALVGILIRNSVILIVEIEELRSSGRSAWNAVVEATEHRMRPIMLTAAAATLALIPISHEIFWGPMAYAMMGGIVVGTALTLLFLPALYVAWFRIPRDVEQN
jgi:multidrug efflux pump subunit AcrB